MTWTKVKANPYEPPWLPASTQTWEIGVTPEPVVGVSGTVARGLIEMQIEQERFAKQMRELGYETT
jgi:hypothetical protein